MNRSQTNEDNSTDSCLVLQHLQTLSSLSKQDPDYEILIMYAIQNLRLHVRFVWAPTHVEINSQTNMQSKLLDQ